MKQLRERLLHYGSSTFSNEELLTLILQTGSTSSDISRQVATLLADCGGLGGIIRADLGEFCQDYHFSPAKAVQLQAVLELAKRLATQPAEKKCQIRCAADAANVVMAEMAHLNHEQFRVLVLDTKNQVVANQVLYQGTLNSSVVRIAEVFRPAITRKCAGIIVFHNHPSGSIDASLEDVEMTRQLVEAGKLLEIDMHDHIIIGNFRFLSLREQMGW